jgi:hypothetical protein
MAMIPLIVPPFPNVPLAPGVPAVARALGSAPVLGAVTLVSDAVIVLRMFQGPQWGLFLAGPTQGLFLGGASSAIVGDSCYAVALAQDVRISKYPVEKGGFASYNKVNDPFNGKVTFTVSGALSLGNIVSAIQSGSIGGALNALTGQSARNSFLTLVDAAVKSLDLYSLVTPDFTYPSVNLVHYDYARTSHDGATMLTVDIWVEEVRVTGGAAYSKTTTPAGADPVNGGTVQAQAPTSEQQSVAPVVPVVSSPL